MMTWVWIFAGLAIAIAAHAVGHVLCAGIGGIPIRLISIGEGPVLLHGRLATTGLELRILPIAGFVVPGSGSPVPRHRMLLFILGGVLGNAAVISLAAELSALHPASDLPAGLHDGLTAVIWAQVFVIIVNLIPLHSIGERLPSDGQQLLEFLRGTSGDIGYMTLLRRYSEGRAPQLSEATLRLLPLIAANERWTDAEVRHSIHCAILSELERGELSREEELLMLDCLVTDVLMFGDQAPDSTFRPRLDEWSRRAFELGSDVDTIRACRGGVLVELGHYADGKALLVSVGDDIDFIDSLMRDIVLARAERALGNNHAARQLIEVASLYLAAAARHRALNDPALVGVVTLADRVKREIANQLSR
jgi:hypothetical protein